ncbi:ABC transporter integral membrane type 1 [Penicillium citrinum]|uniref:ABC transporter integral membrane type 1 n=1 Tax=Penicillium citrinum TaxID=5077 RepID=A0A9W9TH16_PENCI|nr:ABC transporter integral membrane type 1 [Penicillium citrinum]KAJ5222393.1 ABC transporter integral membrane type 1 [Penicillium citrinum]
MARKSHFIEHDADDFKQGAENKSNESKPKKQTKPGWKSLFYFSNRRHIPIIIAGSVFALLAGCVTTALAIFLGDVFNAFTAFGDGDIEYDGLHSKILSGALGMIALGAAGWFLNGVYYAAFMIFGEFQASTVQREIFIELLSRDVEWFEAQEEGSGALLSRIQAQIQDLKTATSQPLGLLLQYSCRSLASLGLGFYTSWRLSLVTLAGFPIFLMIIALLSARMKMSIIDQQMELAQASKVANNALASIDTVKCYNGQRFEVRKFSTRIQKSASHYLRRARLNSLQFAFIRWMVFGMFVQGFWYGSSLARGGQLSPGEVLRTFWACLTAAQSIEQVLPQMIVIEKGKVAGESLKSIIQTRAKGRRMSEMKGTLYPVHCEGDVEVNNVSFAYPSQPGTIVLQPSTFFFPAGETTFVIGKSGSGKSTLSQLLMRFYLPSSGQILIDGKRLNELCVSWTRNNITLLEQRSVLFNDSVLRNIGFGSKSHENITRYDVEDAIDLAMLEDTIDSLPKGLDTSVGPGGSFLSGGQRQRVAIARARLRDTPILILDEPTSALDQTNRIAVMKSIREWRKGKTTIIITHDLSHILDDDFVYVLDQGNIVHSGYWQGIEIQLGVDKYFSAQDQASKVSEAKPRRHWSKASSFYQQESDDSLGDLHPAMPPPTRQGKRDTWAQHHIPTALRSSTLAIATTKYWNKPSHPNEFKTTSSNTRENKLSHRSRTVSIVPEKTQLPSQDWLKSLAATPTAIEMNEITAVSLENDRVSADDDIQITNQPQSPEKPSSPRKPSRHRSLRGLGRPRRAKNEKPMPLSHIMGTIFPNLTRKQRAILILGIASSLAHATATPLFSFCLSKLFTTFYAGADSARLSMVWSLAVLGVSFGDGLASFFMHYFLEFSGEAWMDTIRNRAFKRILDQPRAWFEKDSNSAPRLTAYLDQNGEDMRNLLGRFAGYVIVALTIVSIAIIWSLVMCWKLTLVALACGPLIYAITRGFEATNGMWERRTNAANSIVFDIFTETFAEIRTVRTLTLEGYFHQKHTQAMSRALTVGLKRAIYTGMLFGLVESTVIFANVPQINTAREIAAQLLRLARLPRDASHEHQGHLKATNLTPIKLTATNFRYPSRPKTLVLRNVSLSVYQNSCTAIVGRSGSGKSTIASLLLALYEAPLDQSGRPTVTLGGHDILRLHVPTLRSQLAVVSQQPTIFPGTVHENIRYGISTHSRLASSAHVQEAAQAAGIDDFISSLPMGYSTVIGDGGVGLSGGQKQRLVIARALLRQPQILILDEATSSLDPAGAKIVCETIHRLVATRNDLTVIIITHSKDMMKIADHVIVLDQGVVVEDGSYATLSQRLDGKLYELIHDPAGESN